MPKSLKVFSYFLLIAIFLLGIIFYVVPNKDGMTEVLLYFSYVLFALTILSALVLPLINLMNNPKGLKTGLLNVALVVVVFGIAFLLSSGKPLDVAVNPAPSAFTLKITDTGLYVTYILAAGTILSIVVGGIVNMVRNR